jgi:hypothetical protein
MNMKTIKTVALAALLSTSFITSPALADTVSPPTGNTADATTQAAEQAQCDALAALHGPATGDNDHWSATVAEGAVTLVTGPTETGNRVIDTNTVVGTGTFVPSVLEIHGNPVRIGGSVNMFGDQWASAGYYPDSTYNFTADFASTWAHAFSCNISQEVYHPAVYHPPVHHDQVGHWIVDPDAHGNEEANTNNCNAFNQSLPLGPPQGGNTQANCLYIVDTAAYDDPEYTDPAYWDAPALVGNENGVAVNQDQSDNLNGFEDHGGIVQVTGAYHVGQVVICISPGSKGGSWRTQNGYGGGSLTGPAAGCNTPYFKIAPYYAGSQTSNGTFISVPHYVYP